jgi:hypothetical protein
VKKIDLFALPPPFLAGIFFPASERNFHSSREILAGNVSQFRAAAA